VQQPSTSVRRTMSEKHVVRRRTSPDGITEPKNRPHSIIQNRAANGMRACRIRQSPIRWTERQVSNVTVATLGPPSVSLGRDLAVWRCLDCLTDESKGPGLRQSPSLSRSRNLVRSQRWNRTPRWRANSGQFNVRRWRGSLCLMMAVTRERRFVFAERERSSVDQRVMWSFLTIP